MISGIDIQRTLRSTSSYELIGDGHYDTEFVKTLQAHTQTSQHQIIKLPFTAIDKEKSFRAGFRTDGWSKSNDLDLHLSLDAPHCQAGTTCKGTIQIEDQIGIKLEHVKVALLGVEETLGRITPNRKGFLLQAGEIKDYDSILENQKDQKFTSWDFQLDLKPHLPSSLAHSWASIRYVLFCEVGYRKLGQRQLIITGASRNVLMLEKVERKVISAWLTTCVLGELNFQPNLFSVNNNDGLFKVVVKLTKKVWLAGSPITIGFLGSNLSGKKVTQIKIQLIRTIMIFNATNLIAPIHTIRTPLRRANFNDKAILANFDDNEFDLALNIDTPTNSRTITNARHLSVTFSLRISLHTRLGTTVRLDLPFTLLHPTSLQQAPLPLLTPPPFIPPTLPPSPSLSILK